MGKQTFIVEKVARKIAAKRRGTARVDVNASTVAMEIGDAFEHYYRERAKRK